MLIQNEKDMCKCSWLATSCPFLCLPCPAPSILVSHMCTLSLSATVGNCSFSI